MRLANLLPKVQLEHQSSIMNQHQNSIAVFGLCAAILLPNAAQAVAPAIVTIDDSSPAETITVSWSGFFAGPVFVNNVLQPDTGSLTFNESAVNTINFSGTWNSGGLAIAPTYVDFYEDGTLTTVSDNLVYSVGIGAGISTFNLSFTSDMEGGPPLLPQAGAGVFVEQLDLSGNPLAYQHQYNTLQPLSFSVTSAPEVVPEPSIIALGFLGVFLGIRRLRAREQVA